MQAAGKMKFRNSEKPYRHIVREKSPLIHCLTNHISILDCANIALALGTRPIMAEHPKEVREITQMADALVCNLGNITDERMESILISRQAAQEKGIPVIYDLVGVGCSSLRLAFSQKCMEKIRPAVLKGNMSEILAFAGKTNHARGIEAGREDQVTEEMLEESCRWISGLGKKLDTIIVVTGEYDLISDGLKTYAVHNGCADMGRITGTGCMLDVVLAAFAGVMRDSTKEELGFVMAYATAMYGICGEEALAGCGVGSGRIRLFDRIDQVTDEEIREKMKVKQYESD